MMLSFREPRTPETLAGITRGITRNTQCIYTTGAIAGYGPPLSCPGEPEGRMEMQGPRGDEALQGLDGYEQMVDTFAEQAKAYWRLWGPRANGPWHRRLGGDATRVRSVAAPKHG